MMPAKLLLAFALSFSITTCEDATKRLDSSAALTDFIGFPPVTISNQRTFQGSPDLAALQRTRVLGNFHHRFHPTRGSYHFGVNPSQVLLVPQAQISPPQDHNNNNRAVQQTPILRPPSPHQDTLNLRPGFTPPQDSLSSQQNFNALHHPPLPKISAFGSYHDQTIKNSFPSNSPQTIKFSISSQNYNPTPGRQSGNSAAVPQNVNFQSTPNFTSNRFASKFQSPGRVFSTGDQVPDPNFHSQSAHLNGPLRDGPNNFQVFNTQPAKHLSGSPDASFSAGESFKYNTGTLSNYNTRHEQSNEIFSGSLRTPSLHQNTQSGLLLSEPKNLSPVIQSSVELKQDDFIRQQKQQIVQSNFAVSKTQTQQAQAYAQPALQPNLFDFNSTRQQNQQQQQQQRKHSLQEQGASLNPNAAHAAQQYFEYKTTESLRTPGTLGQKEQKGLSVETSFKPTTGSEGERKLGNKKSQEYLQYNSIANLPTEQYFGDASSSSASAPREEFTTVSSTYRNPKTVVKEITINLNDQTKISGDGLPAQLYVKEDRQKGFPSLKEKGEKEHQRKNEKSHEDLINDQIRKLLQSHNLEIIGKDSESQTNSQEVQLSKVSEQFKKYNYSVQLLNGGALLSDFKTKSNQKSQATLPPLPELPDYVKKQYDIKLVPKDELLKQFDLSGDHDLGNESSNLFLANGEQLEIVKFSKNGIMDKIPVGIKSATERSTTTAKSPKVLFEELTQQVIPPGADFELIKHKGDGRVEKVEGLTGEKRVTFVFLEEQPDGTVKIQGVKGNTDQKLEENEDVSSLIKKIENGSLKLPPSQRQPGRHRDENSRFAPTTAKNLDVASLGSSAVQNFSPKDANAESQFAGPSDRAPTTEFAYSSPYSVDLDPKYTSRFYETTPEPVTTFLPTLNYIRSSSKKPAKKITPSRDFLPTVSSDESSFTSTFGLRRLKPTTTPSPPPSSWLGEVEGTQKYNAPKTYPIKEAAKSSDSEILNQRSTEYRSQRIRVPEDVIAEESNLNAVRPLNEVLKENGLNEMAKFLDQSGLNTILNETGPYTIFIPTDKAFRTLETQLGGPDKAEDKFRENPRLLSGLLLHHVVPGSFRLEDLQDEMTGVSLAGTQLRVNTYNTDEKHSHENRIVTINGAKVSREDKDIVVPQGLAHSIDRVLFPLPIGDIIQTLKNDREKRFTKFLKALEYSDLADVLTGSKTYTVFAPTDKAFSVLTDAELDKLLTRREAAKTIALRHIVPGTLYTAGMNYFQVKDSMETGQKITIKKESGKIKANSAHIISANIPATNGVIHAVETLL